MVPALFPVTPMMSIGASSGRRQERPTYKRRAIRRLARPKQVWDAAAQNAAWCAALGDLCAPLEGAVGDPWPPLLSPFHPPICASAPDDVSSLGAAAKPNAIGKTLRREIISDLILPIMSASKQQEFWEHSKLILRPCWDTVRLFSKSAVFSAASRT
jgi:hypothetical protein